MKKFLIFCILIINFFILCITSHAQITVKLQKPPLNMLKVEHMWRVTITNNSTNSYNVYLSGDVKEKKDGQIVQSKSNSFLIKPGIKIVTPGDIKSEETIWNNSKYEETIIRTGSAPEGNYTMCVKVINAEDNKLLANDCLEHLVKLQLPVKLTLVNPRNSDTVTKSNLTFIWTQAINIPQNTIYNYKMKIVNINQGQTPENAMKNNPSFHEADIGTQINYPYPLSAPAMDSGKSYAWKISVLTENDTLYESAVWKYTIRSSTPKDTTEDTSYSPIVYDTLNTDCQGSYQPEQITNTTVSEKNIEQLKNSNIKIGLFSMKILDATGSASALTGTGSIIVPWLKTPIAVEFKNIKINTDDRVYQGFVITQMDDSAATWPKQWALNSIGNFNWTKEQIERLNSILQNPLLDKLADKYNIQEKINNYLYTPLKLPLGINNAKGYTIAITEMKIDPEEPAKLNCVAIFPFTDNDSIGFKGQELLCSPQNPSAQSGVIRLLQDEPFFSNSSTYNITVKQGTDTNGTYISWDCSGFKSLNIDMDVEFPRTWLKPKPDDEVSKVKCNITAHITDWNDWIARVMLPKSTITGTQGLELESTEMYYDHSDINNASGMDFPDNYNGEKGVAFEGFYLKNAKIIFPDNFRSFADTSRKLTVNINNFIISSPGVTGTIRAYNLYNFGNEKANISGLGASLDTFKLILSNSNPEEANLKGRIILPLSKSAAADSNNILNYQALFTESSGFQFVLKPLNSIEAELFADASLTLDNTSFITLDINKKLDFNCTLNGQVGWDNMDIDIVKKVNLGAKFQNLKMGYTGSGGFTFNKGSWSFASPQKWLANFPITINNVDIVNKTPQSGEIKRSALRFSVSLNLTENLGGNTTFDLIGALSLNNGRFTPSFIKAEIDSINLYANFPAVKLKGFIRFFHDDSKFGNGFRGSVKATFCMTKMEISAELRMGSTKYNSSDYYRYWFADAKVLFPRTMAVPFLPGFAFYGFGAAAWKNMNEPDSANFQLNINDINNATQLSSSTSSQNWIPQKNRIGFKLISTVGTYPDPKTFNSDVSLGATFNTSTGGISQITFRGNCWGIADLLDRNNATIKGGLGVNYNFANKIFDLSAWITGKYSSDSGNIINGQGNFKIYIDGAVGVWYLTFGTPRHTNTIKLFNTFNVWNYFMCGNYLGEFIKTGFHDSTIAGLSRAGINVSKLGNPPTTEVKNPTKNGKGFAFGIGAFYNKTWEKSFWPHRSWSTVCLNIDAGTEINLSVLNYGNATCNGEQVGFRGWYAKGGLALWFSASTWIKKWPNDKLTVKTAGALTGGFPNPFYVRGALAVSIFGYDFDANLNYGNICEPTSVDTTVQFEQEYATEQIGKLINYTVPVTNPATLRVDPKVPIKIAYSFEPNQTFEIIEQQSNGTTKNRIFKVEYSTAFQATCSAPLGQTMFVILPPYPETVNLYRYSKNSSGEYEYYTTPKSGKSIPGHNLNSEKGYKLIITGTLKEKINGTWVNAKNRYNQNIIESKTITFFTDKSVQ